MTTLEQLRAEIEAEPYISKMEVLDLIDEYAEQEQISPCEDSTKECITNCFKCEWSSFYKAEQEPTIPCDLCGFNTDEVCEYLSVCPATGKAARDDKRRSD